MSGRFLYIPLPSDEPDVSELSIRLNEVLRDLKNLFDTLGISYGYTVSVANTGSPSTDFTVNHKLGAIPDGYIVVYKSTAGDIYNGDTAWTAQNIYLKANVANMSIKLLVFTNTN